MDCLHCRTHLLASWSCCPHCGRPSPAAANSPESRSLFVFGQPLLRQMLDNLDCGILFLTCHRCIGYINTAARTMFGVGESGQPIGRPVHEWIQDPHCLEMIDHTLTHGTLPVPEKKDTEETSPLEIALKREARYPHLYRVDASDLSDTSGALPGKLFLFMDVTALRRAEKIREGCISHELRTPLTPLTGFVRTLLDDEAEEWYDRETRREFYFILDVNLDRLLHLSDEMLDIEAKIQREVDNKIPDWTRIGLREIALEALEVVKPRAVKHTFVLDLEWDEVDASADPEMLRAVLESWLTSAVKYSPDSGEVRIISRKRPVDADFACVTLMLGVQYMGVALPKSFLAKRGAKFFDARTSPGESNRRLGWGHIQRIAEECGGEALIESEEGIGSTSWLRLPIAPPRPAEARANLRGIALQGGEKMICSDCLSEILAVWRYCPQCGRPSNAGSAAPDAFSASADRRAVSLEALFDRLPVPVLFVTQRRRLGHINRAACALFGVDPYRNPIGKPFEEFIRHPECVALFQRFLAEDARSLADVSEEQRDVPAEITIRHGDAVRIYQVHPSPLCEVGGLPPGTAFIFQEITDLRKQAQMQKEFISIVSHELRTPLTPMKGFVRALIDDENEEWYDRETRREFYGIIDANVDRLSRLINDLLNISRIEKLGADGVEMNWEPNVSLRKVVEEVLGIQKGRTDKHTFVLDFDPEDITLESDPDKLQNILQNFVSNAIKFSPDGGEVRIIARLKPADEEFLYDGVLVGVKDQGMGMPPAFLKKIGKKFERADNVGTRKAGGTGIGLYVVKALLAAHKGVMTAESEIGKGSTFWIRLPLQQPKPPVASSE